jgi:hypothetical protein
LAIEGNAPAVSAAIVVGGIALKPDPAAAPTIGATRLKRSAGVVAGKAVFDRAEFDTRSVRARRGVRRADALARSKVHQSLDLTRWDAGAVATDAAGAAGFVGGWLTEAGGTDVAWLVARLDAADVSGAETALTFVGGGAGLPESFVALADAARAVGLPDAVVVGLTGCEAGGSCRVAAEETARRSRRHAGAVAGTGEGRLRAVRARRRSADDLGTGECGAVCRRLAVADGSARVAAWACLPVAVRNAADRDARSYAVWNVAGFALAGAGAVAADPVDAVEGGAIGGAGARGAVRLSGRSLECRGPVVADQGGDEAAGDRFEQ